MSVADAPNATELEAAVAHLLEPLADFRLVDAASRAHAVALMLLPFVRDRVDGPTPLHLFKKSIAGEGASLLTDTLLCPALGSDISRLSSVRDDDEWRKEITSVLLEGPSARDASQNHTTTRQSVCARSWWFRRSTNAIAPRTVGPLTGLSPAQPRKPTGGAYFRQLASMQAPHRSGVGEPAEMSIGAAA